MADTDKTKLCAIRFPQNLLIDLKHHVKRGKRGDFIVKATERALLEFRQAQALQECRGIYDAQAYPEFSTSEATQDWVEALRKDADQNKCTTHEE